MKRIYYLFATLLLVVLGNCSKEYDDTEVWDSIHALEERMKAVETVLKAYENNLMISSVVEIEDGYVITFTDGSTATIKDGQDGTDGKDGAPGKDGQDGADGKDGAPGKDGQDGADGDTYIANISISESEVTFYLTDGTTFSIPLYSALSIAFESDDLVIMQVNSTREIRYTVKSAFPDIKVEAVSSTDIKAKVIPETNSAGIIQISTSDKIDEYSKVIVFVSNGEKVIMRSLNFEEAGITVKENAEKYITKRGGELSLEFLANVECEVIIPEEAQSWISVLPQTRILEERSIKLLVGANDSYYRTAKVYVQSLVGDIKLEYTIEQDGELGYPDDIVPPDNEIWWKHTKRNNVNYGGVSIDKAAINANLIFSGSEKGRNVLRFDAPVTHLKYGAFSGDGLSELYLPDCVEYIAYNAIHETYLTTLRIPKNLKECGGISGAWNTKLSLLTGHHVTEDGKCLVLGDKLVSFVGNVEEYTLPSGIKTIQEHAIDLDPMLRTLVIPEGVETIEDGGIWCCLQNSPIYDENKEHLEYISLPSTLHHIGKPLSAETCDALTVFADLRHIKRFLGESQLISEGGYCLISNGFLLKFANGSGLESYEIPEGVISIDDYAFTYAEDLKELRFPSTFKSIPFKGRAFLGTYNIEKIYGPNVLEDNRSLVIDGSLIYVAPKGLKEYVTPESVDNLGFMALADLVDLENLVISDSVKGVCLRPTAYAHHGYLLHNCPNLKTVTISANIPDLKQMPFGEGEGGHYYIDCYQYGIKPNNLESVYLRAIIPPSIFHYDPNGKVSSLFENLTIYVPQESLGLYLASSDWAPYRTYFQGYKYTDLPEIDHYVSSDYSKDGEVVTFQTATKGAGIDIVLLGDGYSDRQIADGTYDNSMYWAYEELFTVEPYKSYKEYFNVYYINAVSATEGYAYGSSVFSGYFGEGTEVGGDHTTVKEYSLRALSRDRMDNATLVVIMNSENYGGTCYMYNPEHPNSYAPGLTISYIPEQSLNDSFIGILHHEVLGHGFVKLGDEYAYEDLGAFPSNLLESYQISQRDWGWWKNVDFTNDLTTIAWSHFINDTRYANEGLAAYEGGLTYWSGVWRPTENSIMRYNTGGFNAPSRESIYKRIHHLAYGDSWIYDYETFVEWDAINRTEAAVATRRAAAVHAQKGEGVRLISTPPIILGRSWHEEE